MAWVSGDAARALFGVDCATEAFRLPLTRSSTGEVADAGVVGDLNTLSFGLRLSMRLLCWCARFETRDSARSQFVAGSAVGCNGHIRSPVVGAKVPGSRRRSKDVANIEVSRGGTLERR